MERLLLLYNPQAGKGQVKSRLAAMLDIFTKSGWLVTAYPTQGKADATEIAARYGGAYDRVVCCGGDGTLNETVAGLLRLDDPPVLGYVPAGTTNDFSRNLHLPRGYEARAETAANGVPRPCDIGRFNGQTFVYVAAFGAFTDVAYDTPQPFKNMFGHMAYLMEGIARLGSLKGYPLRIEHDGGAEEGEFIFGMVSNTVSVGGLIGLPANQVELDDGLFEVILVRTPRGGVELQAAMTALLNKATDPAAGVLGFHSSRVTVSGGGELPWTLDGEYGGAPQTAEIENRRRAITIVYGQ